MSALGIPTSTLSDHLRSAVPRAEYGKSKQKLSPDQEASVVEWRLQDERSDRAPSRAEVVAFT